MNTVRHVVRLAVACVVAALFALRPAPARAALAIQDRPLFEVVETLGTLRYVAANRSGVSASTALRTLEAMGVFVLHFEDPELVNLLERNTMTLSFDRMEAVAVAELCAVASGLDLITERQPPVGGNPGNLVATVVRAPVPDTDAGRERLLDWGLRWYRNLLENELSSARINANTEAKIRIDSALLDMARGNWSAAAGGFRWLVDSNPTHPWVPEALLREAQCRLSAGEASDAAQRAARVMKLYRDDPVGAKAATVYARAALDQHRHEVEAGRFIAASTLLDSLVIEIELFLPSFRDRAEYPEVLLLLGEAQRRRGKADLVVDALARLESVADPILLPQQQWASTTFLRGCAGIMLGDFDRGRERLWQFLRMAPQDSRAGIAWLTIAQAELSFDPLEAMFAARKAAEKTTFLTAAERGQALTIEAKAALLLGDTQGAVERLERVIRDRGPRNVPDLAVEVGKAFMAHGSLERAKSIVLPLQDELGIHADRARVIILESEMRQGQPGVVVRLAPRFAARTTDAASQVAISTLVGDAYRALGMKSEAARAYDGRIR